jgi:hypothetical protein
LAKPTGCVEEPVWHSWEYIEVENKATAKIHAKRFMPLLSPRSISISTALISLQVQAGRIFLVAVVLWLMGKLTIS